MSSVTCVSGWSLPSDAAASGQGEIGWLLRQGGFEFKFGAALGEGGFQFDLGGVDGLAGGGLLFLGQRAELLHQRGELAVRAQVVDARLFERRQVRARRAAPPAPPASTVRFGPGIQP